ncbi:pyridoxal phosphate-dependent decarboxylase family protein [Fulvivirga lutimaris]|uniref:pyridoxal phosphate-dependent decarboxylase family protein n=1 Tax=Fulvivirga lutimaris TaxID=1819566 RepID=UPI0012BBA3A6|nr:aminotransferase class V-fold PLP-dependent enzyme [Fulvivirga lutimaris]MTI41589.1 aspartate aminotransferase family protein [Fulvivirga lutimaris]
MQGQKELEILGATLEKLQRNFGYPIHETDINYNSLEKVLSDVANKMGDNYPYFDPNYAGQMLKPPHPIARMAYTLAMHINPNNHALDGGRASSAMEKEAVADIAKMFGWDEHIGHLTGGGTMANMEALWIARKIHPDKIVVASEMAHYTHERISEVVGLGFSKVSCDQLGRMDLEALEDLLKTKNVGTVVATLGTTGTGSVDPLTKILALQKKYHFRIHVDAAYGGYFKLAENLDPETADQYANIHHADSIVIDPHKHGLQPYGCGCIIFKDALVGGYYQHDSPYTYFSSAELHLGEISLECSRAGAAAVALWATMKYFPIIPKGEFAQGLEKCHEAALKLYNLIENDETSISLFKPEIDIVVWAPKGDSLSSISNKSSDVFEKAAKKGVHLALIKIPVKLLSSSWNDVEKDQDYVTCLRSCLMKHEHFDWVDHIWKTIKDVSH